MKPNNKLLKHIVNRNNLREDNPKLSVESQSKMQWKLLLICLFLNFLKEGKVSFDYTI